MRKGGITKKIREVRKQNTFTFTYTFLQEIFEMVKIENANKPSLHFFLIIVFNLYRLGETTSRDSTHETTLYMWQTRNYMAFT